ncbi:MAG TPA: trypsin [Planctomycetaceae bacterium]|nr:trypsin [Planctomycetaceae bacterium]
MAESLLLAVTRITTMKGDKILSEATGFYFTRDGVVFLITNKHVVRDEPTSHQPDRLLIDLHPDSQNLAKLSQFTLPLYQEGRPLWKEASDRTSEVDIVAIPLDVSRFPENCEYVCFEMEHISENLDHVEIGASLLIPGFPLGFHDELHHLPVARHAIVASSFGLRFKGMGYFLSDGRTHRGCSGAPVVTQMVSDPKHKLPWRLLGVHSSRFDVRRDIRADEALGLNSAWYSDIILKMTDPEKMEEKNKDTTSGSE